MLHFNVGKSFFTFAFLVTSLSGYVLNSLKERKEIVTKDNYLTQNTTPENGNITETPNPNINNQNNDTNDNSNNLLKDPYQPLYQSTPKATNGNPEKQLKMYGGNKFSFSFGKSYYLSENDRPDATSLPNSSGVIGGLAPKTEMKINLHGNVENHVFFDIDYDLNENFNTNEIKIQYRANDDEKFLQELTFGKIDLNINHSDLIFADSTPFTALGIDIKMKHKKWTFETVASISGSIHNSEIFNGVNKTSKLIIPEYQYIRKQYYQLEPFAYYDGMSSAPVDITANNYDRTNVAALNVLASSNNNITTTSVNIDIGSVVIHVDDNNPKNDNTLKVSAKSIGLNFLGNYHKLREGADFSVDYKSGRIYFTRPLSPESRVFIEYTRNGGSTVSTDPSARIVNGKIEVFLKYGKSLHEDINFDGVTDFTATDDIEIIKDGVVNLDVYEVRGIYSLRSKDIQQIDFQFDFIAANKDVVAKTSPMPYYIDYDNGLITYRQREPFRFIKDDAGAFLLDDLTARSIYAETQSSYVADNSEVSMRFNFSAKSRSYQLSHFNIVPNTESVKINNEVIDPNLYYIDYQTGYFRFLNRLNPLITDASKINIQYDYLPFGQEKQSYIVGARTEFKANRNLTLGTSVFYESEVSPLTAPYIGQEPEAKLIAGIDAKFQQNETTFTRMINQITGSQFERIPIRLDGYAEYAHSFYTSNIIGIAIIDDMESSEEVVNASLISGKWMLSNPPSGSAFTQCNRAPLYYKYYYDPSNFERGLLDFASGATASPSYSFASGPYNVAETHVSQAQSGNSVVNSSSSLVLDFDFAQAPDNTTPYVSIQTDGISQNQLDLSGTEYIEISVKLQDAVNLAAGVELRMDIGIIAEDVDQDGVLDSEDVGLDLINGDTNGNNILDAGENWDNGEKNGVIDYNRGTGVSEDSGYAFDPPACSGANTYVGRGPNISGYPATVGNGYLNSEDINKNGKLDSYEQVIKVDPAQAYISVDSAPGNVVTATGWTKLRFYFNQANFTSFENNVLRKIENLRISLTPKGGGSIGSGKLLIDELKFAGSLWRNKIAKKWVDIKESSLNDSDVLRITTINTLNNSNEYLNNSFLINRRSEYEKLHGEKTNSELYSTLEGTIKLKYNLDATYELAITQRQFMQPFDIFYYKYLNIWINHRSYSSDLLNMVVRIGNGNEDYIEYLMPIQKKGWQKIKLDLSKPNKIVGTPKLREISTISVGIKKDPAEVGAVTGESWINDIFVSEAKIRNDYAYKFDTSIAMTEPLIVTDAGTPIISDLRLNYHKKHKNYEFKAIGDTRSEALESEERFGISTKVLPFWKATYSYSESQKSSLYNEADSLDFIGDQVDRVHSTAHQFTPKNQYAPIIIAKYDYRVQTIKNEDELYHSTDKATFDNTYNKVELIPNVIIKEKFPKLLGANITCQVEAKTNMLKTTHRIVRSGSAGSSVVQNYIQKAQTDTSGASVMIDSKTINFSPKIKYSQSLLLSKNYTDSVTTDILSSNYYFPIVEMPEDFRYISRSSQFEIDLLLKNIFIFSPFLSASTIYIENNFKDNYRLNSDASYRRTKQPASLTTFSFNIPVKRDVLRKVQFLENISLNFSRELILEESGLPFETMSGVYQDDIGLPRILPSMLNNAFNMFDKPPWYFLSSAADSGQHYAFGREYITNNQYNPQDIQTLSNDHYADYNNSLLLRENISLQARWKLHESATLQTEGRIAQDVRRQSLDALPNQNVNIGYSLNLNLDMKELMNSWPWNYDGVSSSYMNVGFTHNIIEHITENIEENAITPDISLNFSWYAARKILQGLSFTFHVGVRTYKHKTYITPDDSALDEKLYNAMPGSLNSYINKIDTNYFFSMKYFTEVPGLKSFLQNALKLSIDHNPRYNIELSADLFRYDYELLSLLERKALDQYILSQSLDMNLHRNITGILAFLLVYDIHRNPFDNEIMQEIFSFQIGFSVNLLF